MIQNRDDYGGHARARNRADGARIKRERVETTTRQSAWQRERVNMWCVGEKPKRKTQ